MKKSRELQEEIYNYYNRQCFVCGGKSNQLAHIIGDTYCNVKIYGKEIIDHESNVLPACNLHHNSLIDISKNMIGEGKIAALIEEKILNGTETRRKINIIVRENIKRKRGKNEKTIHSRGGDGNDHRFSPR